MKKILLILAILNYSVICTAQEITKNDLKSINMGAKIYFDIDYSDAVIMGLSESDFANYEQDWVKDKTAVELSFLRGVNNKVDEIYNIGALKDADYALTVIVKSITNKGYLICDAKITDKSGKVYFYVININSGSKSKLIPGTNLSKIKASSLFAGRSLGKIMKKYSK